MLTLILKADGILPTRLIIFPTFNSDRARRAITRLCRIPSSRRDATRRCGGFELQSHFIWSVSAYCWRSTTASLMGRVTRSRTYPPASMVSNPDLLASSFERFGINYNIF